MDPNKKPAEKQTSRRYPLRLAAAAAAGAGAGFLYYFFVGCAGGACPISSNPVISTLYGGVIGLVLGLGFIKRSGS